LLPDFKNLKQLLETLITSKTRLRLLIKFFVAATNKGYLNGLAQEFGESTNAIRKELNHLASAGYLTKNRENNKIQYLANAAHPLFSSIQKIVHQHLGLELIAEQVIKRMGAVETISLVGDYANGIDSGTIEIVISGKQFNLDYLSRLSIKIETQIKRRIKISVEPEPPKEGIILFINASGD
tara:strand:+ start:54 stop:599 length:546 start_codon:yes stop_codon:yes gene_type:complete